MKIASNVFSVIGIVTSLIIAVVMTMSRLPFYPAFWVLFGFCFIFALCGIASTQKIVFVGIMMILFVNLLSGIFYLCWRD